MGSVTSNKQASKQASEPAVLKAAVLLLFRSRVGIQINESTISSKSIMSITVCLVICSVGSLIGRRDHTGGLDSTTVLLEAAALFLFVFLFLGSVSSSSSQRSCSNRQISTLFFIATWSTRSIEQGPTRYSGAKGSRTINRGLNPFLFD